MSSYCCCCLVLDKPLSNRPSCILTVTEVICTLSPVWSWPLLFPAGTRRRISVGLTLVHRLRRWTNVKPTLIRRLVSAGLWCPSCGMPSRWSVLFLPWLPWMQTVTSGVGGQWGRGVCRCRRWTRCPVSGSPSPDTPAQSPPATCDSYKIRTSITMIRSCRRAKIKESNVLTTWSHVDNMRSCWQYKVMLTMLWYHFQSFALRHFLALPTRFTPTGYS